MGKVDRIDTVIVNGQVVIACTGDTRACPDCGRPQHYTGHENGWAHDALIDTWECNDPRKAGA